MSVLDSITKNISLQHEGVTTRSQTFEQQKREFVNTLAILARQNQAYIGTENKIKNVIEIFEYIRHHKYIFNRTTPEFRRTVFEKLTEFQKDPRHDFPAGRASFYKNELFPPEE